MKKIINGLFGANTGTHTKPTSGFRPRVEDLEGRALMSVVGPELHVNTTTTLNQDQVAVASAPVVNGGSVVAWRHQYNSTATDTDIYVQRYDGFGNKVGGQITVAAGIYRESEPSVAVAANGNFVVVWTEAVNNSANTNIVAQRYFANGTVNGGRIQVATDTRGEYDPDVAMDAAGNFVVSYTLRYSSTDLDVYAKRYTAGGALLGTTVVAGSGLNEHSSSVARSPNGRFSIAYQVNTTSTNTDISLRRYDASGNLLGTHAVANTGVSELDPEVAMDAAGNAVVVYEHVFSSFDHDIKARRVSSTGVLGATMSVDSSGDYEFNPGIAVDLSDGDFVVAYQRLRNTGSGLAGPNQMIVREMSAGGSIKNTINLGDRATASLSMNGSDVYFLGDTGYNLPGDAGLGIYGRRGILV